MTVEEGQKEKNKQESKKIEKNPSFAIIWVSYTNKRVEEEQDYMMNPYGRTEARTKTYERRREKIRGIKELAEKYIEYMQEVERNPERYSSIFEEWESFRIRIVDQEGEEIEINKEIIARKAIEMIEIQEIMELDRGGRKMSNKIIEEICDELKVDSIPFYNAIEIKGKTVILNRERLAEEIEAKRGMTYEEFIESEHQIMNNSEEEIEEAIEKLRSYYKENLIIYIKKNTRRRE